MPSATTQFEPLVCCIAASGGIVVLRHAYATISVRRRVRQRGAKVSALVCSVIVLLTAGCAVHPMIDDVSHPHKTEDIVRHARCEMREAIIVSIGKTAAFQKAFPGGDVGKQVKAVADKIDSIDKSNKQTGDSARLVKFRDKLTKDEFWLRRYMNVAVAYDLNFNVTESSRSDASAGFKLPFTTTAALDVNTAASLALTRQGQRQFKTGDRWGRLIQSEACNGYDQRGKNILYPIAGAIGIDRLVATFVDISEQGGAKDSFVETLTFTSQVGAGAKAVLKLDAVMDSFRLVSAGLAHEKGRLDVHKMVMSLVFPFEDRVSPITGAELTDGYLNAPFDRSPDWRARYNICVADARAREDQFNALRHEAPEVYCIRYADAFAPMAAPVAARVRSTNNSVRRIIQSEPPSIPRESARRSSAPEQTAVPSLYGTRRPDSAQ